MTAQITVRASAELVDRVKAASSAAGRSMNDYITAVLDAATDPNLAESLAESVRDRLRRAGLLVDPAHPGGDAPPQLVDAERLAAARRRAGRGTPLAQLVADGR